MSTHDKHDNVPSADTPKQAWSPPQMTEIDAVAVTLAGGVALADSDPNEPS